MQKNAYIGTGAGSKWACFNFVTVGTKGGEQLMRVV